MNSSRPETRVIAGVSGLGAEEARVLGALLEKQRTTPEAYPLSLNSLRLAANQSTNRDPVVDYDDGTIRDALHRLERRGLVRLASGAGSRAAKYRHLLADALPMDPAEQALVCVLLLRGPQTPGELKQRSERMHPFADLGAVHEALQRLIDRNIVARLPRRPGHKEERYAQLLQDEPAPAPPGANATEPEPVPSPAASVAEPGPVPAPAAGAAERAGLDRLAERVTRLEREVAELRAAMRDPSIQAP
ncbi:MAG TPA: YceH family protein [Solirubrobacteraceae bacterium]